MRIRLFAAAFALTGLVAAGCGDGETKETATASGSSSASSGMVEDAVNGCTAAAADDQTGKADVTIKIDGGTFKYSPACVTVTKGTSVTFSGDLSMHPLVGGEFINNVQAPDPASPIKETTSGMSVSFTLADAGSFPYYCKFHTSLKMYGVIYVK